MSWRFTGSPGTDAAGVGWRTSTSRRAPGGSDLLGHGHSPWEPPWTINDHADALSAVLDRHVPTDARPVVLLAHSFGSAVCLELAQRRPDDIAGLVLLDPAQGLDPDFAGAVAEAAMAHWGSTDADDAKVAKRMEGWHSVSPTSSTPRWNSI